MLAIRLKEKDDKIPMGALPDIVFLLLIFFLITTTIDPEKGIGLTLPPFHPTKQLVPPSQLTNILINSSGQILVDKEIVPIQNLKSIIKEKLYTRPNLIASVLTDRATNYDIYIKVLDQLKQAWGNQPARISIAEPVEN
jgi:biopolymer transport protein ExbD